MVGSCVIIWNVCKSYKLIDLQETAKQLYQVYVLTLYIYIAIKLCMVDENIRYSLMVTIQVFENITSHSNQTIFHAQCKLPDMSRYFI